MRWRLIVVAGAMALVMADCGFGRWGAAPSNLELHVFNQTHESATVHWDDAGAGAGTATIPLAGCSAFGTAFDPGSLVLTVTDSTATLSLTISSDAGAPIDQAFVIRPDGITQFFRVPNLGTLTEPTAPPLC